LRGKAGQQRGKVQSTRDPEAAALESCVPEYRKQKDAMDHRDMGGEARHARRPY